MGEFALGQAVSRFEDPRLLRGGGRYVDDLALPHMAYGFVLRSGHAHARIRAIDTEAAKAAPGVLAVLTGADWEASGWGDLPVPVGPKRRDGKPLYRPRYPGLVTDRVRWVGDYVAFIVAETYAQAADAAELVAVDYEELPAVIGTAASLAAGAPRVWDDCADNICFVHLEGDKAATEAAFATAAHVVRHDFVINRVTGATMEPRGSVGEYNATEDRYTIHTTLQRTHTFRAELAHSVLKVPENRIRVVCGDIGGSFGMKSAVYNEVALVLLAAKAVARPVKWTSTRSEAFLGDAQARDNVTTAELALDRDFRFLGLRVHTIANLGAYLQTGGNVFVGNLGTLAGVYRTPAIHVDVTGVFTNTNPMRPSSSSASSISPPTSLASTRSNCAAAISSRQRRCRSRPASPSLTIAASSAARWTWRSTSPTMPASRHAARKRRSAANYAALACPTASSAPPRRVSRAPRSASTAAAR